MKHFIFLVCYVLIASISIAQSQKKRVLFIGNSYTYENNLPQLLANVASSTGDTLIHDSSTPGGFTFMGHCNNATTLNKIAAGNWNYVVLQEQSQLPSFPQSQVNTQVMPYAKRLDSLIHLQNICAETIFYMTWGRKNGDASNCGNWPPVCSYTGMDSLLALRYRMMADNNNALLSPVGAVWRMLRQNFPGINLYQPDESHPSLAGSYAAACSFYAIVFRKNPLLISTDAGLPPADAASIRAAAKQVVYDSLLKWNVGKRDPVAAFVHQVTGNQLNAASTSSNATSYQWNFGDGVISSQQNPQHYYTQTGNFTVTLIVSRCGRSDTASAVVSILASGLDQIKNSRLRIFPNPVSDILNITGLNDTANYTLLDLNGRVLRKGEVSADAGVIDAGLLEKGIYILEITTQKREQFQFKLVKAE